MASRDVLSILVFCLGFLDVIVKLGEIGKTSNYNAHVHGHFNEHVNLGFEWPPEMCLFLICFSFFSGCFFKPDFCFFQITLSNHIFSDFFRLLFQTRIVSHSKSCFFKK